MSQPRLYTKQDIIQITHNRSVRIGGGGFGDVYKGWVADEHTPGETIVVAVKILRGDQTQALQSFQREREFTATHPNIVKLIGYCDRPASLVYEYMSGGDLSQVLSSQAALSKLSLWQRVHILYQVARALGFCHTLEQPIRHWDVKPNNILLDATLTCAKLSDFGLAKPLVDTMATSSYPGAERGTYAYMCPEYKDGRRYTAEMDVYSFGIVLLQVVTGKSHHRDAIELAFDYTNKNLPVESLKDKHMPGDVPLDVLRNLIELGIACKSIAVDRRPKMDGPTFPDLSVVGRLRAILATGQFVDSMTDHLVAELRRQPKRKEDMEPTIQLTMDTQNSNPTQLEYTQNLNHPDDHLLGHLNPLQAGGDLLDSLQTVGFRVARGLP